MKIKIVRKRLIVNWGEGEEETYDVYHGFTGWPLSWNPFHTRWVLDKAGMSENELMKYMSMILTSCGTVKITTVLSIPY
jgi:hypothetical protein